MVDGHSVYLWPWKEAWWKPTPEDRIRELVKAGALIVAEIDRLRRKEEAHTKARRHEEVKEDASSADGQWIPVADRLLPAPQIHVQLVNIDSANRTVTNGFHMGGSWFCAAGYRILTPTHWMALPEPPKTEGEVQG